MRAMAGALAEDGVLFRDYQAEGLSLSEIVDTTLRMSKLGLVDIYEQAQLGEDVNLLVVVDQFEEKAKDEDETEFGTIFLVLRALLEHGIEVGGGLGKLAGQIWRIGLMGENARARCVERLAEALENVIA